MLFDLFGDVLWFFPDTMKKRYLQGFRRFSLELELKDVT
jgi:hypothetical protein